METDNRSVKLRLTALQSAIEQRLNDIIIIINIILAAKTDVHSYRARGERGLLVGFREVRNGKTNDSIYYNEILCLFGYIFELINN